MKHKLYIETSIISYYTARPSRDVIVAARQKITREIWPKIQNEFESYISALVIQEASRGDKIASSKRLSVLSNIPVLELTLQAKELARVLIIKNAIPLNAEEDALHIALASLNGMEFLLTWNFSHINNAFQMKSILNTIVAHGLVAPTICSPDELIGN
jgi:hypothetical protein